MDNVAAGVIARALSEGLRAIAAAISQAGDTVALAIELANRKQD